MFFSGSLFMRDAIARTQAIPRPRLDLSRSCSRVPLVRRAVSLFGGERDVLVLGAGVLALGSVWRVGPLTAVGGDLTSRTAPRYRGASALYGKRARVSNVIIGPAVTGPQSSVAVG